MSDIEVYKRALLREKQARKDAERLLDNKTRELYESVIDLQKLVDELSETQTRLVHSEKMASIGQMAAGVAHEINTPVGFSLSNIDTLKEYVGAFSELNEFINLEAKDHHDLFDMIEKKREELDMEFIEEDIEHIIKDAEKGLNRVKGIVANLGKVSRPSDGRFESADINECLEDSIKMVWSQLKQEIKLDKQLGKIPNINCKESELQQVFINMLVNASHACDDNDRTSNIKVTTQKTTKDNKNFVVVSIQDNGKGISSENIKKLFDPFFTTKAVGKGTGLGLSVSYGIIERHGGYIDVDSKEEEGTKFNIYLPA